MASTDARPLSRKNVAYRVTFPILDADGDLVTGATGLDSEVSKDGGTFADCTNEATEIATSSGVYYLDLTSTEMNADTVAVIVKTSSTGAKTTTLVFYPEEAGDVRTDVVQWNGTAVATPDTAGIPQVNVKQWLGGTIPAVGTTGVPKVDLVRVNNTTAPFTTATLISDAVTDATVADAVWDEATSGHATAGTTGKALTDILAGASAAAIADAVWDEATSGHTTAGTTGKAITDAQSAGNPWESVAADNNTAGTMGAVLNVIRRIFQ